MDFQYTRHQVPRGARPDAITADSIYLIKNVSQLRATYQIKLLAFEASASRKKLILKVPEKCLFDSSLKRLVKEMKNTIKRENF